MTKTPNGMPTTRPNWGCFTPLFGADVLYLRLLRLYEHDALSTAVKHLQESSTHPDWESDSVRLLCEESWGWRCHLVVLVAYVLAPDRNENVAKACMLAMTELSWVSPQLAAGLLEKGHDVVEPINTLLRHSAHATHGVGKLVNAAVGLGLRSQLDIDDDALANLIKEDCDNGADIAHRWQAQLRSLTAGLHTNENGRLAPIHVGGFYADVDEASGKCLLYRLLDVEEDGIHVSTFWDAFPSVPTLEEALALSPDILHAPVDLDVLVNPNVRLVGEAPLKMADLEGYEVYLEEALDLPVSERWPRLRKAILRSKQPPLTVVLNHHDDAFRALQIDFGDDDTA